MRMKRACGSNGPWDGGSERRCSTSCCRIVACAAERRSTRRACCVRTAGPNCPSSANRAAPAAVCRSAISLARRTVRRMHPLPSALCPRPRGAALRRRQPSADPGPETPRPDRNRARPGPLDGPRRRGAGRRGRLRRAGAAALDAPVRPAASTSPPCWPRRSRGSAGSGSSRWCSGARGVRLRKAAWVARRACATCGAPFRCRRAWSRASRASGCCWSTT